MNVTVVDYANSNAHSILRALNAIGIEPQFSPNAHTIANSDFLILPGVGHTGSALAELRRRDLVSPLEDAVLGRKIPVMGICLGMQIMVDYVEEGDCEGLGWVTGRARVLEVADRYRYKVPHIGWNSVVPDPASRLLPSDGTDPAYYFCHKYTVDGLEETDSISHFSYESERVAVFEKGNIFGVQFHPEKSQDAGRALFRRFFERV
ncbi:imidazole glycerol phosphate synthase subunit HisH [Novosphingopyxis sp. YJ-S2-01]|uniref:imidazole glycerol phosphate synthase subunit HisH n=1 Tax=Novosphingopyxis sp. YJ-S2-01 TaxID=2794021 RepID=UPI0018DBA05D|nr:imidazole glycerol phosphate synthase subunit HisH [Novosphingopyxis sp. YJ-S2-01]MBH9538447.1 imidazole glycerol phosphate synthase subunit HisH [Novosphingopyxis sp. YJ-S2-01]